MLTSRDDLRHDLGADPRARESLYWCVPLPDEGLMLFAYFFIGADGVPGTLCGALGHDSREPLVVEASPQVGFDGDDLDAFTAGPLRVTQLEALRTCTVAFAGERIALSFHFDGAHEAFDFARNPSGTPPGAATNRFEQGGRAHGSFRIGDRRGEFSVLGWRDHSWGPRDWELIQHYKLITMTNGDGLSACVFEAFIAGQVYVNGFIERDGLLSPITQARIRSRYDDAYLQQTAELALKDQAGRTTRITAERSFAGSLALGPVEICSAPSHFDMEGTTATGNLEYMWPQGYRTHAANSIAAST